MESLLRKLYNTIKSAAAGVKGESGQSMAEFVILIPVVLIIMMLPLDYARAFYSRMLLNTATTEALSQLAPGDITGGAGVRSKLINSISVSYGDILDVGRISIDSMVLSGDNKKDYTYYVYTSDKSKEAFENQFDKRDSNYIYKTVKIKVSLDMTPLTPLGRQFLGDTFKVSTREYSRNVYLEGYVP